MFWLDFLLQKVPSLLIYLNDLVPLRPRYNFHGHNHNQNERKNERKKE